MTRTSIIVVAVLIVASMAAAAMAMGMSDRSVPDSLEPTAAPVYLTLAAGEAPIGRSATLKVSQVDGARVRATGASGVVTRVYAKVGDVLAAGSPLIRINDRDLVLVQSTEPLYRQLGSGDSGPDVAALQHLLSQSGAQNVPRDGRYGPVTHRAWRSWLTAHRLPSTTPFSPEYFVAVPGALTVAAASVEVGQVAPPLGETLFEGLATPTLHTVELEGTVPIAGQEEYRFRVGGTAIDLSLKNGVWTVRDNAALTDLLAAMEGEPESSGGVAPNPPQSEKGAGGQGAGEPSLPAGAGAGPPLTTLRGFLETQKPIPTVTVPATAILIGASGSVCVLTRRDGEPVRPKATRVLGTTPTGAALVEVGGLTGLELLVNPSRSQRRTPCP